MAKIFGSKNKHNRAKRGFWITRKWVSSKTIGQPAGAQRKTPPRWSFKRGITFITSIYRELSLLFLQLQTEICEYIKGGRIGFVKADSDSTNCSGHQCFIKSNFKEKKCFARLLAIMVFSPCPNTDQLRQRVQSEKNLNNSLSSWKFLC